MKKTKKINFALVILSISIIVGFLLYGTLLEKKVADRSYNRKQEFLNYCIKYNINDEECAYTNKYIGNKQKLTLDTVSFYMENVISYRTHMLNYLLPILIILPAVYNLFVLFRSKDILNSINKIDYKKWLKKMLLQEYKFAFILPVSVGIIFLITFLIVGHFDYSYVNLLDKYNLFFWFSMNGIVFVLFYFLTLFLFSIFYINLGLIVSRKNRSIIITIIESFLLFIGIEFAIELVSAIPSFLGYSQFDTTNILNVLSVGYAKNPYEMILVPLILVIISFIVVLFLYKNKEKFIKNKLSDCKTV